MKDIILYGASGFGKEVLWLIDENNKVKQEWNILGFVDNNPELQGKKVSNYPVLGDENWLLEYSEPVFVTCCIGNTRIRKKVVDNLRENPNVSFPNLIANNVVYSDSVEFGEGIIICSSNILTVDIEVGDFVHINLASTVGHDAIIEEFVTIYPGVNVSGNVKVASGAELGTGSKVIQGVHIGENTIVGSGAVVVKHLPKNCTAVGAPAKPIKFH